MGTISSPDRKHVSGDPRAHYVAQAPQPPFVLELSMKEQFVKNLLFAIITCHCFHTFTFHE